MLEQKTWVINAKDCEHNKDIDYLFLIYSELFKANLLYDVIYF